MSYSECNLYEGVTYVRMTLTGCRWLSLKMGDCKSRCRFTCRRSADRARRRQQPTHIVSFRSTTTPSPDADTSGSTSASDPTSPPTTSLSTSAARRWALRQLTALRSARTAHRWDRAPASSHCHTTRKIKQVSNQPLKTAMRNAHYVYVRKSTDSVLNLPHETKIGN